MSRTVMWSPDMEPLGSAVVAIGVFDGVHLGHCALLAEAVDYAIARGVPAVAVTFDRDPDQVVAPDTAAPQLLTLADKIDCIVGCGVKTVLVVPFTSVLAGMAPEKFVTDVLLKGVTPLSIHVGADFRFGASARGDVSTLQRLAAEHGFEVCPQHLLAVDGAPVTSTRIRALVAAGDVSGAAALLGRPTRVAGTVHHGRGEGAELGFATANVVPVPFAALPADGVYAGRAVLADGDEWASAISVGTPPMFPEARDYLEAHLIDFQGDLYGQNMTLNFFERLRDQRSYASLDELKAAIAADVAAGLEIAGFSAEELGEEEASDGIDDIATGEWVPVVSQITILTGPDASARGYAVVAPLEAANIPYLWDPFPPADMSGATRGALPQLFTVRVPAESLDAAEQALLDGGSAYAPNWDAAADYVDDPAALEAAEQAVRKVDRQPRKLAPEPLDGWKTVARNMGYDKRRLGAIEYALSAAGIPAEWQPFSPTEAPLLRLFGLHDTIFSLRVPEDDLEAARILIREVDARDA